MWYLYTHLANGQKFVWSQAKHNRLSSMPAALLKTYRISVFATQAQATSAAGLPAMGDPFE